VIYDPNTSSAIADSLDIVKYLDNTYPETPQLFLRGTEAFQKAVLDGYGKTGLEASIWYIIVARQVGILNPVSGNWYRSRYEGLYGGKLEDWNTPEQWANLKKGLSQLRTWYEANGEGRDVTLLGEQGKFTFSDIQIQCALLYFKIIVGAESEDWKRIEKWDGGFWIRYMEQFRKYEEEK